AEEPSHRPNRKRHQAAATSGQSQDLQLVETQGAPAPSPVADDDAPRRTKPRRRRGGATPSEPLQLVETEGDAPSHSEGNTTTP
ncbi:MAG TPA: hypothetical protein VGI57_11255, partial [Usitatibacter sp.]